ncbi:hypothetical protein ACJQWK_02449 [Exserohilum turcicum]
MRWPCVVVLCERCLGRAASALALACLGSVVRIANFSDFSMQDNAEKVGSWREREMSVSRADYGAVGWRTVGHVPRFTVAAACLPCLLFACALAVLPLPGR